MQKKSFSAIPFSLFSSFVRKEFAQEGAGFESEFKQLYKVSEKQWQDKNTLFATSLLKENSKRNRYSDVPANESSRVKLQTGSSDYINANYIDGQKLFGSPVSYIAAQGPLEETQGDFWRMVYENKVAVILMVTKTEESGRSKCSTYWPESGTTKIINALNQVQNVKTESITATTTQAEKELRVSHVSTEVVSKPNKISQVNVKVSGEAGKEWTVKLVQFASWPDHGVPAETTSFRFLRGYVNMVHAEAPVEGPVVVHCSAGIGRTGTYCTVDIVLHQYSLAKQQNALASFTVDVFGIVAKLREQRCGMVQMLAQYKFIYKVLEEELQQQQP